MLAQARPAPPSPTGSLTQIRSHTEPGDPAGRLSGRYSATRPQVSTLLRQKKWDWGDETQTHCPLQPHPHLSSLRRGGKADDSALLSSTVAAASEAQATPRQGPDPTSHPSILSCPLPICPLPQLGGWQSLKGLPVSRHPPQSLLTPQLVQLFCCSDNSTPRELGLG